MSQFNANALLSIAEALIFSAGGRRFSILFLSLATLFLTWQTALVRPDANFEKNIPLDHPYMQVLRQYQADFGGANTVLVAIQQKTGDIYNPAFLQTLEQATQDVTFVPGIDRTRVASLFTRNIMFLEVDEEGFSGDNIVPPDYEPTPETLALIKTNVGKAGLRGHLVSLNQRGAMITSEVLARDPATDKPIDMVRVSAFLEDQVRGRYTANFKYELLAKKALPPFEKGEVVRDIFHEPGLDRWFGTFEASKTDSKGKKTTDFLSAHDLEFRRTDNPQFNPNIDIHMIGFALVVGDVADATLGVIGFFLITLLATLFALVWYLGDFKLALLPMLCSIAAILWEFGLLHLAGMGLDPFAILVPFLVVAVSTSHGVQYVNRWADDVAAGASSVDASRAVFRRLFIPGSIALLTNIAGFLTIYLVPIDAVRELALHASLGMLAVLVGNKWIMPILLASLPIRDREKFSEKRQRKIGQGDRLWHTLSAVTAAGPAKFLVASSLIVLGISFWLSQDRITGDAQAGVPELRPDSTYNQDVDAILQNFAIGTDVLKIVAETAENACIKFTELEQVDRFAWNIRNVEGVTSVVSAVQIAKQIYAAMNEQNPRFHVLPRNRYSLVLATTPIETSSGLLNFDCTAMPLVVFTEDHRADTIKRIVDFSESYNEKNAAEFFALNPEASQEICEQRIQMRRKIGNRLTDRRQELDRLAAAGINEALAFDELSVQIISEDINQRKAELAQLSSACPVNFALATGNLGVMAATNEAVEKAEWPALAWVYAVVLTLLLVSYRSLTGWLVIGLPLFMVSVFANALMAQLGIGLKVATLPVVTFAVGIGVDYGIYVYDVFHEKLRNRAMTLRKAYFETLHETGKAVLFTGLCMAGGVSAWLFSDLQFQRDMGLLLIFMFSANMLGAVFLLPALMALITKRQ